MRGRRQAARDGVAREQARGHHDRRVGGVRARRDGGDHDVAVVHGLAVRALARRVGGAEAGGDVGQRHAILRAARAGEAGRDAVEVELDERAERRRGIAVAAEEALLLVVRVDERHEVAAPGGAQVAQHLVVDREERGGRAVLGRHVGERRAVGQRERREAVAAELDEAADDAVAAQQLGQREHEVGRGHALAQRAGHAHADDRGRAELERLAEHDRLGLDAADAEAEHAEPVDHRRVRVGADERVGHGDAVADRHDAAEVLEVDLVHDAHARRHDAEGAERALGPAQQQVALAVALVLALDVVRVGLQRAGLVDLHRVVDHEVARARADRRGPDRGPARAIAARIAARSTTAGTPVKSCSSTRAGKNGTRMPGAGRLRPGREREHVLLAHVQPAGVAQQALEQDPHGVRQPLRVGCTGLVEPVDAEEIGRAREARAGAEEVACHCQDSIAARMSALAESALADAAHGCDGPARSAGRPAGTALPERAALCLDAYLPLFADARASARRRAALRRARARAHRALARAARATSWRRSRSARGSSPSSWQRSTGAPSCSRWPSARPSAAARAPDGPWLAQNWDWYADAPERCLVWSAAVEGARFATMTEAGILAKVGVSTRGIAVALNILYHASDGRGELGVPVHLVLRRLLGEAASVEDAWALLRETPFSASSCITVVDARGGGRVLRALAGRRRADRAARRPARAQQPLPRRRARAQPRPSSRRTGCPARARASRPQSRGAARAGRRARAARRPTTPIRRRSAGTTSRRASPTGRSSAPSSRSRCAPACPSCAWPRASRASARSSLRGVASGSAERQTPRTSGARPGRARVAPRSRQPTPRRQLKRSDGRAVAARTSRGPETRCGSPRARARDRRRRAVVRRRRRPAARRWPLGVTLAPGTTLRPRRAAVGGRRRRRAAGPGRRRRRQRATAASVALRACSACI